MRSSVRRVVIVFASVFAAAIAYVAVSPAPRPPATGADVRAIEWKLAVRYCRQDLALMALVSLDVKDDLATLRTHANQYMEACGEGPNVLAMAYRAACKTGDAPHARFFRARLEEVGGDATTRWRNVPCRPLARDAHPVQGSPEDALAPAVASPQFD